MEFLRIGDKLVSRQRVHKVVDDILDLRAAGQSQQDVADRLGVDRTLVSRLEGIGAVRRGGAIAVVGFPVANRDEVVAVASAEGVDFAFVLSDAERWQWLQKSGVELFTEIMTLMTRVRACPNVVILGQNQPARFVEALLDKTATVVRMTQTPGSDGHFDAAALRSVLRGIKGAEQ